MGPTFFPFKVSYCMINQKLGNRKEKRGLLAFGGANPMDSEVLSGGDKG